MGNTEEARAERFGQRLFVRIILPFGHQLESSPIAYV